MSNNNDYQVITQFDDVDMELYLGYLSKCKIYIGDEIRFLRKFKIIPEGCIFCNKITPFKRIVSCAKCNKTSEDEVDKIQDFVKAYLKNTIIKY